MANIVMIIAPMNFRDEEYFEPKRILENSGHTVTTASKMTGTINGSRGGTAQASLLLQDVHWRKFDAVVFVGGPGSYQYDLDTDAHTIAQDFYANHKLTTAICHAPIILAQAGVLSDKKATVHDGDIDELKKLGVAYVAQNVVVDGRIITANGPAAATDFGKTIAAHLAS